MTDATELRLLLDGAAQRPTGSVVSAGQVPLRFEGWLQLMSAVERALDLARQSDLQTPDSRPPAEQP